MKKLLTFLRNQHEEIYKIGLFCIAIVLIVFMLPKQGRFKYEFEQGKPWLHEDLIAPFDFAIYKSAEVLELEKALAANQNKSYFNKNSKVKGEAVKEFENNFIEKWNGKYGNEINHQKRTESLEFGVRILNELYSKGIIAVEDFLDGKKTNFNISVVENNIETEQELSQLLTVETANTFITNKLAAAPESIDVKLLKEQLYNSIYHNIFYDKELTNNILNESIKSISLTKGKVQKNASIVKKGDLVDKNSYAILMSYKKEYESKLGGSAVLSIYLGQLIMVGMAFFLLVQFMLLFRKDLFENSGKIVFLILLIVSMVFAGTQALKMDVNIYVVPFCVLPIVLRVFYDTRLALYVHIITVLIVGYFAPNAFQFVYMQIIAGAVAIFSISNLKNRSQFFITSLIIFVIYSFTHLSLGLMQEGDVLEIKYGVLKWFAINAILTLLIYPLIYLFEKVFNFVSDITLLELSDTNSKLLKKLAQKAPGTFQHSLQVANLAEAAVEKIGGNTLLVRTGALYHDIGKMKAPYYFIENQSTEVNPHDDLAFEESASIIIDHVIDGVEMAKKHNIPDVIIDFIRTHHGTSIVQYFYQSFLKNYPDEIIDEARFRYPGPLPYSKETAVLMMADSVEAASRSIKQKTETNIDVLVNKIIDSQVDNGQFNNANITLRDIKEIKLIFKKMLMNIYHVRIEY